MKYYNINTYYLVLMQSTAETVDTSVKKQELTEELKTLIADKESYDRVYNIGRIAAKVWCLDKNDDEVVRAFRDYRPYLESLKQRRTLKKDEDAIPEIDFVKEIRETILEKNGITPDDLNDMHIWDGIEAGLVDIVGVDFSNRK